MTMIPLPADGDTSWSDWAGAVHNRVDVAVADGGLFVSPLGSDTLNDGLSLGAPLKTITAALAKITAAGVIGGEIRLAPGQHLYGATDGTGGGSTIRVFSNVSIRGTSSGAGGGSVIVRTVDDGNPMFDSAPGEPIGAFHAENFQIATQLTGLPTYNATAHGFKLHCLTNNSSIRGIEGLRLRGDLINLTPNITTGDTLHGMFNAELAQVFGVACGGHVVRIAGQPVGVVRTPDGINCRGGLLHIGNGVSNQAVVLVDQPMWEGGSLTGVSTQPVTLDNMGGQTVLFNGGTFTGATASTDVIRMTGASSATPLLVGCSGYNFTNWINDTVSGFTLAMSPRTTYFTNEFNAATMTAQGQGALMEVYNTSGTANRRRYRWSVSGGIYVLSQRNDDGTSAGDLLYLHGDTGRLEVVNSLKVDGNVGFYNTTPIAKPTGVAVSSAGIHAALVSLGLISG